MIKNIQEYKDAMGLVESTDPEIEKPIHRRKSFDGIRTMHEMDEELGSFVRAKREERGLTRAQLAPLLGLSTQVYGRYERAFSKMHVTRMIHLCELLGFMPIEMLFKAAPHLWGETREDAEDRLALVKLVVKLPRNTTKDLLRMVEHLVDRETDDGIPESVKTASEEKDESR